MQPNSLNCPHPDHQHGAQMGEALDCLNRLLVDGLKHGFFEYSMSCELGKKGQRQLVIRAGKSHRFTIPEADLPD